MERADSNMDAYSSLPVEKWWGDENLYLWQGFWFRLQYLQATQEVHNHFDAVPSDVILASFPKTGTTWLKALLYSIINRSSRDSLITNNPHELVPSLEVQIYRRDIASAHSPARSPSGGIFNTHIPYQLLPETIKTGECRVVYITRNPKDTFVSLWHFVGNSTKPWPLEMALERFCSGVVPYGSYFDHVLGYWKESLERPKKVFFISYEELKEDPKTHVKRLAEFLGCPFSGEDEEEKEVEEIVRSCSFERLSNLEVNKSSDRPTWLPLPYSSYFRQGGMGDHKNYLDPEMIKRIDTITHEKLHGSGLVFGI
ncbi:hypothetical protein HHK36_029892 [Tetracentron sinense]|uniref:Sulfotransferase n=1 Tax=Tetracentron sinense TaxID=13715 RepID=A0A834YFL3_TETSI|nr:hypothetical protein HHK36_029892 [Tetracentron sinense]